MPRLQPDEIVEWRAERGDERFVFVRIVATDQTWETGGTKCPLAHNGYLVERVSGSSEPFIASPPQLRRSTERREREQTAYTPDMILAMFPPLDERTLLAYGLGSANIFPPGSTSVVGGGAVRAANPSESWMFAHLTRLGIEFEYEAHVFELFSEKAGQLRFKPDLFIPEIGVHVELTVSEEWGAKPKRWRIYAMRDQHPDVRCTLMLAQDFIDLAAGPMTREAVLAYFDGGTLVDRGERAAIYAHGADPTVHPRRRGTAALTPYQVEQRLLDQVPAERWPSAA
jgi:hypothetical protein